MLDTPGRVAASWPAAVLTALLIGLVACGETADGSPESGLRVLLEGLAQAPVEFDVRAGDYLLETRGSVSGNTATLDLWLLDAGTDERVGQALLDRPADEVGVREGDTAFDQTLVSIPPDQVVTVAVHLEWSSGSLTSSVNVAYDHIHRPAFVSWSVSPEPILEEDEGFTSSINVRNYNGPPGAGNMESVSGDLFPGDKGPGATGSISFGYTFSATVEVDGFVEEIYDSAEGLRVPVPPAFRTYLLVADGVDATGLAANGAARCLFILPLGARRLAVVNDPADDAAIDVTLVDPGGPTDVAVHVKDASGSDVVGAEVLVFESGNSDNRTAGITDDLGDFQGSLASRQDGSAVDSVRFCVLYAIESWHAVSGIRP